MNEYSDARQHLNLSSLAYDVLNSDKYEFLEKPSFSRIVNMVLSSYMEDSDASIDNAMLRYETRLHETLANIPDDATKMSVMGALLEQYRSELLAAANSHPREVAFKVRLDQNNFSAMQEWHDNSDYYSGIPGNFLKAVIEEYSRKSLFEREGILLRDAIDEINACISSHQLIIITLKGQNRSRYEVRPYSIEHDPGYNYHYLVGYSRKAGTDYEEKPTSFRLSRIIGIKRSHARSGKVTTEQKREIKKKLQSDGVQFLLQESEPIRLKLTMRGKQMYESQAHLRPPFIQREECADGSWIYEFNCTQMQAEYYFFKFGNEAVVETPSELRRRFIKKYRDSYDAYLQE